MPGKSGGADSQPLIKVLSSGIVISKFELPVFPVLTRDNEVGPGGGCEGTVR